MFNDYLKHGEALDELGQGLSIIQHRDKYRFTSDAISLAKFAKVKKGERVCEIGTGCGVIAILLCAKQPLAHYTAIELQEYMADLAMRNVLMNGLEGKIEVKCQDAREYKEGGYSVVVCNPPYQRLDGCDLNISQEIALCRHELALTLQDMIAAAARNLNFGGRLYFIHRAERLADIIYLCRTHGLEVKVICPYGVDANGQAFTILVEAKKGGRSGVRLILPTH